MARTDNRPENLKQGYQSIYSPKSGESWWYNPETGHSYAWTRDGARDLTPEEAGPSIDGHQNEQQVVQDGGRVTSTGLHDTSEGFNKAVAEGKEASTQRSYEDWLKTLGGDLPENMRLGRPEQADVYADPYAVEAQRRALDEISAYGQGGLRESDKQAIQAGQMMQGQYLRGQREAALDQAEMRGMRGGAAQLASDIGAQQGMAQALFMQNADINNAASDRALRALGMQEGAAQGMRRDSFSEGMGRASAVDNWKAEETRRIMMRDAQYGDARERQQDRATGRRREAEEAYRNRPTFWSTLGQGLNTGLTLYGATQGIPPASAPSSAGTQQRQPYHPWYDQDPSDEEG